MSGKRLSFAACAALVAFALLTIVGIFSEAHGSGRADMFASITALECLVLIAVLRPTSFTHLDGGRAMLAFALSVPWSAVHLIEHIDVTPGFGPRVVWLLVAQLTLLIVAAASWAHCRLGLIDGEHQNRDAPRARVVDV